MTNEYGKLEPFQFSIGKLEPSFKAKWITALTGGNYVQGRRALRSCDDEYCCLGVAADIIDPTQWHHQSGPTSNWEFADHDTIIPDDYAEAVGLSGEAQHLLMELNDVVLTDFPTIAAWIEEYL